MNGFWLFLPDGARPDNARRLDSAHGQTRWHVADKAAHVELVHQAIRAGQNDAIVPAAPVIKALFFDMDATVIKEESIDELAAAAGPVLGYDSAVAASPARAPKLIHVIAGGRDLRWLGP